MVQAAFECAFHRHTIERRSLIVGDDELAVAVEQREEVAAADLPEARAAIGDGAAVGGHHGFEAGQVGQQGGLAHQQFATLAGEVLVGLDGVLQVRSEGNADLLPDDGAEDEQADRGEAEAEQQQWDEQGGADAQPGDKA